MEWIVTSLVLAALVVYLIYRGRRCETEWNLLATSLEDLAEGREPSKHDTLHHPRAAALARKLEAVACEQRKEKDFRERRDENFRTILASMEDGLIVVNAQHTVRLHNPVVPRLLELEHVANLSGKRLEDLLDVRDFGEMVDAAFRTAVPQLRDILINDRKVRYLSMRAAPIKDASGEPCVVIMIRDMTRLKELEDVRSEFVANVSHELRTPLSILQGYLENLQDNPDVPREELVEVLNIMARNSWRLSRLLEDLLILARLEARSDDLQLEEMEIPEFLDQMRVDWALKFREKNLKFVVEITAPLRPLVADHFRLEQVFTNLIDNAFKYTEAGGTIKLSARAVDGGVELAVEDSGVGIPVDDLPHIFERFYRADKARSRTLGGTGLGLSIVKHIVQRHGGRVSAHSEWKKGTRIAAWLPELPPEELEAFEDHPQPSPEH